MQALEKLMFSIGVTDQVSGPLGKIDSKIVQLTNNARTGMINAGVGFAGLTGAGYLIQEGLGPALEMQAAFGEVKSLNIGEAALDSLNQKALQFSLKYGENAAEFVAASYKIQSAVQGINGNELSELAYMSSVLAKGTKADFENINTYIGQTFNIFSDQAQELGKIGFAEQVIGKTARAVQLFNTDGKQMVEALKNIGTQGDKSAASLDEQLAVMGLLQNTMVEGSRAATSYAKFLSSTEKAEKVLGLQLTNADTGKALPMVEMLNRINTAYGDLGTAANQQLLQKAFGITGAKTVLALSGNVDQLSKNIADLQSVSDMSLAEDMAASIADPFERWSAGITAVKIGIGQSLLPVLNPLVDSMADGMAVMTEWTQKYPNITRWVGYLALGVVGLTAASAAFTLGMGLAQLSMTGMMTIFGPFIKFFKYLKLHMLLTTGAAWLFNAALWANPMTWMVIGIGVLVGAIGALIYYWDELTAYIADSTPWQFLMTMVNGVVDWFKQLGGWVDWALDKLDAIPGVDFKTDQLQTAAPALDAPKRLKTEQGGVAQQISNAVSNNNRGGNQYHVAINSQTPPGPRDVEHWMDMVAP